MGGAPVGRPLGASAVAVARQPRLSPAEARARVKNTFGSPGKPMTPAAPIPPESPGLAPLAWDPSPDLRDFPREGPGWWFVGKCPSLPVNAWRIVAFVLTELALHCPGPDGTDARAVILDASCLGCTGHPPGFHARNDFDLAYFTRGPTNLTQPSAGAGTLALQQLWHGPGLDLALFDARRTYWLWRRLYEAFKGRLSVQMDEEVAASLRAWARVNLPAGAPLPGEGDPEGLRGIYAHHQHMHVGLVEVSREGVDWSWFSEAAREGRVREYALAQ